MLAVVAAFSGAWAHAAFSLTLSRTGLQGGVDAWATLSNAQRSIPLTWMMGWVELRMTRLDISVVGSLNEALPLAFGAK